ncbi:MAG: hypothetical protein LBR53_00255 [Deltaproteobacteria bacterium]|jgi:hypothetical protein|nr:hypothetical protein [Deltaproteobacteria bacterium]
MEDNNFYNFTNLSNKKSTWSSMTSIKDMFESLPTFYINNRFFKSLHKHDYSQSILERLLYIAAQSILESNAGKNSPQFRNTHTIRLDKGGGPKQNIRKKERAKAWR